MKHLFTWIITIAAILVLTPPSVIHANPPNLDLTGDNHISIADINTYINQLHQQSYSYRNYLHLIYQFDYATNGEYFTIKVGSTETFCLYSTNPSTISHAHKLLEGSSTSTIPVGLVIRNSGGFNYGFGGPEGDVKDRLWNWHMHPTYTHFADITKEVCDGLPHYVELGAITDTHYCPWFAEVITNSCQPL